MHFGVSPFGIQRPFSSCSPRLRGSDRKLHVWLHTFGGPRQLPWPGRQRRIPQALHFVHDEAQHTLRSCVLQAKVLDALAQPDAEAIRQNSRSGDHVLAEGLDDHLLHEIEVEHADADDSGMHRQVYLGHGGEIDANTAEPWGLMRQSHELDDDGALDLQARHADLSDLDLSATEVKIDGRITMVVQFAHDLHVLDILHRIGQELCVRLRLYAFEHDRLGAKATVLGDIHLDPWYARLHETLQQGLH
mmetsp:Transcript_7910/g.19612  ORF Transcript_7910/g.19612 Transcript_7910/m.19612 type:complete len:247 (-) Transcript_7910:787-1527(-)